MELKDGARAIVNYNNILGFSKKIKLGREIDFKFAYLLSQPPIFISVRGRGNLLLATNWKTENEAEQKKEKFRITPEDEKVVFFDMGGYYEIEVDHSPLNVYWDDHSIYAKNFDSFITEVPMGKLKKQIFGTRNLLRKLLFLPLPAFMAFFLIPILIMVLRYVQ